LRPTSLGCPGGILLVTCHGFEVARSAAARLRVDDVLLKPVSAPELVAAVSYAREQGLRRGTPLAPIDPTTTNLADLSELSTGRF
jgi:DNA-binding response OmpR family regulator